ncbi:uncharacterized protein LOC125538754 isoform X4 [Triticum urartu]|uniref:uncharacterized protein LOC125538754 isoform X4 n=1 Tax=Triticum urartu TaxID=4572 RepID=UPI002043CE9C|nr:uncharacterized protein LOC125538754 isoform X4 [Triticum urartu]
MPAKIFQILSTYHRHCRRTLTSGHQEAAPNPTKGSDDGYRYGHLYTYGMFPLSMPSFNPVNDAEVFNGFGTAYIWDVSSVNGSMLSFNPVNDAEVFNGFGMQSHPNVENRSLGCNEGVVYEEALQHISQETKEEDMSQAGFNRWSSAAKGRERQSHHWKFTV